MSSVPAHFKRLEQLINSQKCPTKTETQNNLGLDLGNVILSTLTPIAKKLMNNERPPLLPNSQRMFSRDQYSDYNQSIIEEETSKPILDREKLKDNIHQHIIEFGQKIELQNEINQERLIIAAVLENEEFERFECTNRILYALAKQKAAHNIEKAKQRQHLLKVLHNNRQQLIKQHKKSMVEFEKHLLAKFQAEFDEKLTAEIAKFQIELIENRVQYQLKEKEYLQQIKNIKLEAENLICLQKRNDLMIIQKLFVQFQMDLQQQKTDLITQNTAEQMHILCTEKNRAKINAERIRKEYQDKLNEIQAQNEQLLKWKPQLEDCPNVAVWKDKCFNILKTYEEFIEWIMGEVPGQGKYLLPIQTFLENKLSEDRHENSFYKCSYAGGYIADQQSNEDTHQKDADDDENVEQTGIRNSTLFLARDNSKEMQSNEKPFVIMACNSSELIPEPEPEPAPEPKMEINSSSSTSLSSFEYNSHHYASTKHYIDSKRKHFPESLFETKWEETFEEQCEHFTESEEYEESFQYLDEDNLSTTQEQTFTLHDLIEFIQEADISKVWTNVNCSNLTNLALVKPLICKFIRNIFEQHTKCPGKLQIMAQSNTPSTLLSATDSIDIIRARSSYLSEDDFSDTNELPEIDPKPEEKPILKKIKKEPIIYDHITVDDYIDSFRKVPPYMVSDNRRIPCIWDYKPMTKTEWTEIIERTSSAPVAVVVNDVKNYTSLYDQRQSSGSNKKVRVCELPENITLSNSVKKINLHKMPNRSILRMPHIENCLIETGQ